MSAAVRAVVFDLDGTLVNSLPLVLQAYAHALAPFRPELTEAEIYALLGGPPERFFAELLGEPAQAAEALARLEKFGLENWQLIEPFAGMAELIEALRERCALGLWTGRDRESTEWLLRDHGLAGKVRTYVCGDDLATHKPDPAGLREVLRRLDATPEEALFAGDADVDVLAGAAIGVRTILIEHDRVVEESVKMKAWRVVKTPAEAYAIIRDTVLDSICEK